MREEATCARRVAEEADAALSAEALWRMATANGACALGVEDEFGAIEPGLRADLMLIEYAGGDPHDAVLTATDEEVLATWIDGRAILVSGQLDEAPGAEACVVLDGMAPRVCGVLDAFELSAARFDEYLENVIPLNDNTGQAAAASATRAEMNWPGYLAVHTTGRLHFDGSGPGRAQSAWGTLSAAVSRSGSSARSGRSASACTTSGASSSRGGRPPGSSNPATPGVADGAPWTADPGPSPPGAHRQGRRVEPPSRPGHRHRFTRGWTRSREGHDDGA